MKGWIKLHRGISEHWIWDFKNPDKAMAWIDLLTLARFSDGKIMIKGRPIIIKRGEIGMSQKSFEKRWGWSQNKVKRFLLLLKDDGMIDFKTNDLTTVISICNYDSFQIGESNDGRSDGHTSGQPVGRPDGQQRKNDKKEKNDIYINEFDNDIWPNYPKRAGNNPKSKALKAYSTRRKDTDMSVIIEGMARYAAFCNATGKTGTEYVMQATRFFGPDELYKQTWDIPKATNNGNSKVSDFKASRIELSNRIQAMGSTTGSREPCPELVTED